MATSHAKHSLVGVALCLVGCGQFEPLEKRSAELSEPGPYAVGVMTVRVTDGSRASNADPAQPRSFNVELWYPAQPSARGASDVIDLATEAPPDLVAQLDGLELPVKQQPAARDAAVLGSPQGFPLVLFSHGYGAFRSQSYFLTTHLASHGFVVIAPDHEGNTLFDLASVEGDWTYDAARHAVDRPRDLSFILDRLAASELTNARIEPSIDFERIGVVGHSFGGHTSLLIVSPFASSYDARIDSAIALAPNVTTLPLFGGDPATIVTPTMYIAGKLDGTGAFSEAQAGYSQHSSSRALVGLERAGHFSFTDFCDPELRLAAERLEIFDAQWRSQLLDGCGDQYADLERVHQLVSGFTLAWLSWSLRGQRVDNQWLIPSLTPQEMQRDVELTVQFE